MWAPHQKMGDEEGETVKLHVSSYCMWVKATYTDSYPRVAGSATLPSAACEDMGPRPGSAGNMLIKVVAH
jgi:hypothetical protein